MKRDGILYYILFTVIGAVLAFAVSMTMLRLHSFGRLDEEAVAKIKALQLVDQMSLDLAQASREEWSAVMAQSDQDSRAFAAQAQTAAAAVQEAGRELKTTMDPFFGLNEKGLLMKFSMAFDKYRQVDAELLGLAVQRTNTKAYDLAFGPAARALQDMREALDALTRPRPENPVTSDVLRKAFEAEVGALRIQALLAPHIAEAGDEAMDRLEIRMTKEDRAVREALDAITGLASSQDVQALAAARAAYEHFSSLRADILRLSR